MKEKYFDPSGKEFYPLLDCRCKDDCPISALSIESIRTLAETKIPRDHCLSLAWLMLNGKARAIELGRMRCGHYSVADGRHRICIANKLGITLPANIEMCMAEDCESCTPVQEYSEDPIEIDISK